MIVVLAAAVVFQHIVLIVQENRTPDNLFYALCATNTCSDDGSSGFDIKTANWLDNTSLSGFTQPTSVPLANNYDIPHTHAAFNAMCDLSLGTCLMDGAAGENCITKTVCPSSPQFRYADNSSGQIQPYLDLATEYGWANQMYQTNQGPSFPAHQFLFGATSAIDQASDVGGTFMSENTSNGINFGCASVPYEQVQIIGPHGKELQRNQVFPCAEHQTISDLMDGSGNSWRYYASGIGIWTAPDAIAHICIASGLQCTGSGWRANVDLTSADILTDIGHCNLRDVAWVTPSGQNSDHAQQNDGGGPSWVASIVNAIGQSACGYWQNTAIIVTWDDWGGWYDHEPPQFLPRPQGGYQMGFRVPLLFISAYTPPTISNVRSDFGSIARFIEQNFGFSEGALGFADSRSGSDLTEFVGSRRARAFVPIKAPKGPSFFLHDSRPQTAPDDD